VSAPRKRALRGTATADAKKRRARIARSLSGSLDKSTAALLPIPMRLTCPACNALHIDEGEFATKPHHTHACQSCGNVWRPAIVHTVGVRFLPGFKSGGEA
jgi:hypothetical protein